MDSNHILNNGFVYPSQVLFIKLGPGGSWERECLTEKGNILRFGFRELTHEQCVAGDWDAVQQVLTGHNFHPSTLTRYLTELKYFYGADENTLWITFADQKMWWCFARQEFAGSGVDEKYRSVNGRWSCQDLYGNTLYNTNLSGDLLKTQMYQGTICQVGAADYVIRKIKGEKLPEVQEVEQHLANLEDAVAGLIRHLTDKDFEIFVDLIFRGFGAQRLNPIGKSQKDIDIELLMPVTGERCFVQVKSQASIQTFIHYRNRFEALEGYARFYFVVHSPDRALAAYQESEPQIHLWKMDQLAALAIKAGLLEWLMEKVS